MPSLILKDSGGLATSDVESVARRGTAVEISPDSTAAMLRSREVVDSCLTDGLAHYGINTGFGSLARRRIGDADVAALQRNLIRSHSAGVGEPLPVDVVRGMMLLLAASLCRGMSGVRPVVAETIVALLNAGLTPVVPETGSVGASGDLAPLAHVALACIGEGAFLSPSGHRPARQALTEAGISPLTLQAKEGLAMINGTHLMASQGALLVADFDRVSSAAVAAASMSIDACRATDSFLDARAHAARGHPDPADVAALMRGCLDGSGILPSHRQDDPRVQDPYSFRCAPAVLGSAISAAGHLRTAVERELSAVTDNPLVFPAGYLGRAASVVSAGNFHGMPLAIPLDVLAVAISHVAGIAERRVFWMLAAFEKESRLPHYLTPSPALHSGLMIAQYTAAACCNEIAGLSMPASVTNISTSAGIEDYNSFGPRAASKARRALDLAATVVAIEFLCAAQGIEYQRPLRTGQRLEELHAKIRRVVPPLEADRPPSPDIEAIRLLVLSGELSA